ncbi:TPA: hypothetical protein ACGHB6_002637 [Acinetobacter baumannii]|uniref:hypothetical protein n=1 Tax=Acinetobacter baumannii TaxID=470 RepID=UPI000A3B11BC|nr:hypothetical protein [Acinetobacter baumannii]EHU1307689.1 hypothetical protein [Acinetobacter baumannii]EHU2441343.1 hypothetical protein [Acinetobacter baumannii]EJB5621376.1 hypothetical protein [Acinetobacter baumannii]ELB0340658.1 hypothetical protein [Acinetobacter baumannii]ELN4153669.1 hypothetical protein [Acinetobacter baumannii]
MPQPDQQLERKYISHAELHDLFFVISQHIGFTIEDIEDYEEDIFNLIELWREQGYIDIYIEDSDRRYGRIKNMASVRNSVPYYLNMYHARVVKGEYDPLLVITFEDTDQVHPDGHEMKVASIRFMAIHDDLFGEQDPRVKFNDAAMKQIRKKIDAYRQEGDRYNQEKKSSQ